LFHRLDELQQKFRILTQFSQQIFSLDSTQHGGCHGTNRCASRPSIYERHLADHIACLDGAHTHLPPFHFDLATLDQEDALIEVTLMNELLSRIEFDPFGNLDKSIHRFGWQQ
jgi:hypothetical protein